MRLMGASSHVHVRRSPLLAAMRQTAPISVIAALAAACHAKDAAGQHFRPEGIEEQEGKFSALSRCLANLQRGADGEGTQQTAGERAYNLDVLREVWEAWLPSPVCVLSTTPWC
jgi:hypothetical protein